MNGKTMKAQIFYKPRDMRLETVEMPVVYENEVLIRVKACGICGSDISYYTGHSKTDVSGGAGPLILGHEICGEVVDMGVTAKKTSQLKISDKVIINPLVVCNTCSACAQAHYNLCEKLGQIGVSVNGGFAEYCKAPYNNCIKVPDEISFEEGALFEPLACANYGIKKLDIQLGDKVAVIGSGTIGLMMVQLAKAKGAGKVALIGIIDYSLEKGCELGADLIINSLDEHSNYYSENVKTDIFKRMGCLMDRVIVPTSATSALQQAMEISGNSSTVVFFGLPGENDVIPININTAIRKDQTIKCSWLGPLMWPLAIKEVSNGLVNVSKIITHRFNLNNLTEGLEYMAGADTNKVKGLLVM